MAKEKRKFSDPGIGAGDNATAKRDAGAEQHMEEVAQRIAEDLHPNSALIVGQSMGELVLRLQQRGIAAFGLDASQWVVDGVAPMVRDHCRVGSIADPLPAPLNTRYDLVICNEVLDHMTEQDVERAIDQVCGITDTFIVCGMPEDPSDTRHTGQRRRAMYTHHLAEKDFFDDIIYRPVYLAPQAVCYRLAKTLDEQLDDLNEDYLMARVGSYMASDRVGDCGVPKAMESTVFFEKDGGFREEDAAVFTTWLPSDSALTFNWQCKLKVDAGCTKVRIDPCEGWHCVLCDVKITYDRKPMVCNPLNGFEYNGMLFFDTTDPQITVELGNRFGMVLSIGMKVQLLERQEQMIPAVRKNLGYIGEVVALCDERLSQINSLTAQLQAALDEKRDLFTRCSIAEQNYMVISNAFFWRVTRPVRNALDGFKRVAKKNEHVYLALKTMKWTLRFGPKTAKRYRQDYLMTRRQAYGADNWPTEDEMRVERETAFPRDVWISVIVPLYNTPERFLEEMIQSVMDQTYANWELCLADGSDGEHTQVGSICKKYARKDKRIKYRKLDRNLGISGNSNACIEMATGDYLALLDHDDLLHPSALFEVMKAICEQEAEFIYTDENTFHDVPKDAYCPAFKPDYAPDTLRSYNYICHLSCFSKALLEAAGGGFRSDYDGSQDYDLILRLTEKAKKIIHIPKILYFWRSHAESTASNVAAKPYTLTAAKRALAEHLKRVGLKGEVLDSRIPSTYRIAYSLKGNELISIIIPNKDHAGDLRKCIDSIKRKSTYKHWEIVIVENNSVEDATFRYYEQLKREQNIRVVTYKGEFNYSAINNFGVRYAKGSYFLLLNNDIEVITPDWMEQMLMFAQREDVGAVGAMLYYPDDTVQHAGVILGIGGVAGHSHKNFKRNEYGYMSRLAVAQNLTAVTAACILIPKQVWERIEGLDEAFKVAFNDVDLCMRIRREGYLIVWTPYAELYHYESKSRGYEDTVEKQERFAKEIKLFTKRWQAELERGDPYYNQNLTLEHEDFSIRGAD